MQTGRGLPWRATTSWIQRAAETTTRDRTTSWNTVSSGSPSTSRTSPSASSRPRSSWGSSAGRLVGTELEDLVNLTVNGEVQDPASGLGEHVNDCWPELVGPADRSLVHWLRRLVFRSAWLDQRVKEGELDVVFHEATQHLRLRPARARGRADRAVARAQLGPGRLPAALRRRPPGREPPGALAASRRAAFAIASAPASPTSRSAFIVPLRARSSAGKRRSAVRPASRAMTVVSPPSGATRRR